MTRARKLLRTGLVASALVVITLPAHAEPAVFTVGNYPVEANAKDAVAAKAAALADGQQAALRSLFRRIVPVTAYRRLKAMPQANAADLVDGVSIKDERNSSTQYLATLDVSFRADGVRNVLRRNGIPFVDQQGPQTILIPLYRTSQDGPYTSGKGLWFEAWKSLDLTHTLTPVQLDNLRPEIHSDTLKALVSGTGGAERIIAGEYKSERVVFALAQPDATSKTLVVTLAGTDAVGPFILKRNYKIVGSDTAYAAELAAVIGLGVMEGRWKAAKAGAVGGIDVTAAGGDAVQLQVEFTTLSEWNDIRTRLLEVEGASDVEIGAISGRSARIGLRYPGGAGELSTALMSQGLKMSNSGGVWLVRANF
jgi:Uncharacterized protein conserved in bacteria (DUF2066)